MAHLCTRSFGFRFMRAACPSLLSTTLATCYHANMTQAARAGRGNFFAFFSLPKSPDLNVSAVKRAFHDLQRRVHPDNANVQAKEREEQGQEPHGNASAALGFPTSPSFADVDDSTYANVAYHTLRDPFLRCEYLARLSRAEMAKGGPLSAAEEEALMGKDDQRTVEENRRLRGDSEEKGETMLDEEFLMEMMEANELIFSADAMQEKGAEALKRVIADMEKRDECYYNAAKDMWKRDDFSGFRRTVLEWIYIRNALRNARDRIL